MAWCLIKHEEQLCCYITTAYAYIVRTLFDFAILHKYSHWDLKIPCYIRRPLAGILNLWEVNEDKGAGLWCNFLSTSPRKFPGDPTAYELGYSWGRDVCFYFRTGLQWTPHCSNTESKKPFKPSGYYMYHPLQHTKTLHSAHSVSVCSVWFSQ
jgi:hypothetical protein